jgi:hypothetical protein
MSDSQIEDERKPLPSRALCASLNDEGIILYYVGKDISSELEEQGSPELYCCGLDQCPDGLWVWEGRYIQRTYHDGAWEAEPQGAFRKPTEEEWIKIKQNKCPWDPEDYRDASEPDGWKKQETYLL